MSTADEFRLKLSELVSRYRIPLADDGLEICAFHYQVLCKWNRVMNLVGDLSVETAVYRHYGESLFLASQISGESLLVCDYGSGAGFPGIGFAAVGGSWQVILAEIREKRSVFLREATRGCSRARVYAGDVNALEEPLHWVCSRAVDPKDVVEFAVTRRLDLALLVSSDEAGRLETLLNGLGFSVEVRRIPWREKSSLVVSRQRMNAGST